MDGGNTGQPLVRTQADRCGGGDAVRAHGPSHGLDLAHNELTDRQRELFDLLISHRRVIVDATVRDLAAEMGVAINSVAGFLEALERKGLIRRTPGRTRNIEIVEE